jgi:RNA polymerase sigma-70 factor, ECF subfamily
MLRAAATRVVRGFASTREPVTQDKSQGTREIDEHAGISEEERHERLTQLVLRRSKLSPDEAALLRKVFPTIIDAHHDQVKNLLRRRVLDDHEAEDLLQEVFLTLHTQLLENGFVDSLPAMLHTITEGKLLNYLRAQQRVPFSIGLPSSSSERPRSQLDVLQALHFQEVARRIFPQLSPEHREVLDKVVLKGHTHTEAAAMLGIAEGTLKSRLIAAKRALLALVEPLLPPSQRGPV